MLSDRVLHREESSEILFRIWLHMICTVYSMHDSKLVPGIVGFLCTEL